jgi:hypothetical protein
MNVQFRPPQRLTGLAVVHAITSYAMDTDQLLQEFEIPLSLDGLAMKIAEVDADDPFGACSYPLVDSQVAAFRFVFGMPILQGGGIFYFEPWAKPAHTLPPRKARLLAALRDVGPQPSERRLLGPINERDLTVPTLRLLAATPSGFLATSDIKRELTRRLQPTGRDANLLPGRSDTHFAQKLRNMISNRARCYSFISKGYASYLPEAQGLRITERGRDVLRDLDRYGQAQRQSKTTAPTAPPSPSAAR